MPLRKYQQNCLSAIQENYAEGVNRQLVVLPTGVGKSVISSNLPASIGMVPGEQMLFLAHRNELVDQGAAQMRKWNPDLKVTVDRAHHKPELDADIIVGSVATLGKLNEGDPDLYSERIQMYDPARVRYVQLDEVHTAVASETALQILRYFGVSKEHPENNDPHKLFVGFTATPDRPDGIGLDTICEKIVFGDTYGLREMINDGWLAKMNAFRVETETELDQVKVRHGDFQVSDLENAVNTERRNRLIVAKYKELGNGRRAIGFTVDIQHSHDLATEFKRQGISAVPVSGNTAEDERKRIYADFKDGKVSILLSCGVLLLGFDAPWAEVALMTRPTRSSLLYRQMIGRVLRPYPAPEENLPPIKERAIIIDFCDLCHRHKLITVPSILGLNKDFDIGGKDAIKTVEEVEAVDQQGRLSLVGVKSLAELKSIVEAIDLLEPPKTPDAIKVMTRFAWLPGLNGYRLSVPGKVTLSVREDSLGRYSVYRNIDGNRQTVYHSVESLSDSIKLADGLVPAETRGMLLMDAGWRETQPSDKQVALLGRLDRRMVAKFGSFQAFKQFVMATYTKGQVSSMIDREKERQYK